MKRWVIVEVTGDGEEELLPKFDLFPSCIEFYGDFRVVADWDDSEPKVGREYLASQEQTPDYEAAAKQWYDSLMWPDQYRSWEELPAEGQASYVHRATRAVDAALVGFHPQDKGDER